MMSAVPRPDRRVERTQEAMRHALIGLLAEKPWEEISVQDICDRAGIGRSTFYLHHGHKEELLAAGLDNLRMHLCGGAAAGHPREPFAFMDGLVAHVDQQRQIFRSIIGRRSGHTVQRMFREMIEQLVRDDLAERCAPSDEMALSVHFVAGGVVEALALWIESPGGQTAAGIVRFLKASAQRAAPGS
jgi:AcrR family transcriptional regulator